MNDPSTKPRILLLPGCYNVVWPLPNSAGPPPLPWLNTAFRHYNYMLGRTASWLCPSSAVHSAKASIPGSLDVRDTKLSQL